MAVVTVDFDGTLYQGNSFKVMFQAAQKEYSFKQWGIVGFGIVKAEVVGLLKGKNAFRLEFFKAFAKSFKGKTKAELDEFFEQLVKIGKEDVHHDLVQEIREHQHNGDTVIILSGALHPFLNAFTKALELDVHVISTEIEFEQNGVCTGKLGSIINGDEKVKKVQEWVDREDLQKSDTAEIWAYADSESDIPLFQFATYPVVVNPNQSMKEIAKKNNWPIFAT
ncbi:HAD family hydrolase [Virgibacillus byunsanensis]|uniref:HAD family hydrolase n=1 Tax=Virgibacillus byunsanensis TaxID=570945 RepID=A0ABW3LKP0_9BACI